MRHVSGKTLFSSLLISMGGLIRLPLFDAPGVYQPSASTSCASARGNTKIAATVRSNFLFFRCCKTELCSGDIFMLPLLERQTYVSLQPLKIQLRLPALNRTIAPRRRNAGAAPSIL